PKADLTEPAQTKEKRVSQPDKLANLPALATGYHIPAQSSPDFPAMALLVQILQGDDSSRWYQRLVKEKELTLDLTGGLNYFGNEFDYTGPMIMTTRTTFKPGHTVDEVLKEMDAVTAEIVAKGITDKELADAKVRYKSNFYSQLESSFGKAHLLSVLALFRDDPNQINSLLTPFENVTAAQVKAAAAKYLVASNRTVIERVPEAKSQSGQ
ncbi:MAG TPA: insulinase family protein, partial [Pyrinomonadaceae bacterium]